jgi:hypothetical protein
VSVDIVLVLWIVYQLLRLFKPFLTPQNARWIQDKFDAFVVWLDDFRPAVFVPRTVSRTAIFVFLVLALFIQVAYMLPVLLQSSNNRFSGAYITFVFKWSIVVWLVTLVTMLLWKKVYRLVLFILPRASATLGKALIHAIVLLIVSLVALAAVTKSARGILHPSSVQIPPDIQNTELLQNLALDFNRHHVVWFGLAYPVEIFLNVIAFISLLHAVVFFVLWVLDVLLLPLLRRLAWRIIKTRANPVEVLITILAATYEAIKFATSKR